MSNDKYSDNDKVKILCFIEKLKKKATKNGDTMAFAEISDITTSCEAIIFPKVFSNYSNFLKPEKPLVLSGRISVKDDVAKQIICEKIEFIDNYVNQKSLYIKIANLNDKKVRLASDILKKHNGNSPVFIYLTDEKKLVKSEKLSCNITDDLIYQLSIILGKENIAIK